MATYAGSAGMSAHRDDRPASIVTASRLMYLGAILSALGFLVGFLPILGSLRDQIRKAEPTWSAATVDATFAGMVAGAIAFGLIGAVLWAWMAWKNSAGRRWARILATVFFGVSTLGLLGIATPNGRAGMGSVQLGFTIALWIVGLAAMFFVWRRESTLYYLAGKDATVR